MHIDSLNKTERLALYETARIEYEYLPDQSSNAAPYSIYSSSVYRDNNTGLIYEFEFEDSDEPHEVTVTNPVSNIVSKSAENECKLTYRIIELEKQLKTKEKLIAYLLTYLEENGIDP